MRVLYKDELENLTVQDCCSITAIHGAVTRDLTIIHSDFHLDPDDESFEGINGVHLIPVSDNLPEMFIPIDDPDSRVKAAWETDVLDMTDCSLCYDANDWDMY